MTILPQVLSVGGQGLWSGLSFLTALLLARYLSVEAFGWYAIGLATRQLLLVPLAALVLTPLMVIAGRPGSDGPDGEPARVVVALLRSGLLASLLLGLLGNLLFSVPAFELTVFLVAGVIVDLQRRLHYLEDRPRRDFVGGAINLVVIIAALWSLAWVGWLSLASACLVIGTVGLVWALASGGKRWCARPAPIAWPQLLDMWRIGRWGLASDFAGYVYAQVSLFATLHVVGPAGVAVLELGRQAVSVVQVLLLGMANLWMPKLAKSAARDSAQQFSVFLWRVAAAQAAAGLIALLAVLLSLDYALPWLLPGKEAIYASTVSVANILAFAMVCQLLSQYPSFGVVALGKPQYGFVSRLAACVTLLPVGYGLTFFFGVTGAAWARAIGEALILVLSVGMLYRAMQPRYRVVAAVQ